MGRVHARVPLLYILNKREIKCSRRCIIATTCRSSYKISSTNRKLLTLTKINISDKSLLELLKEYKSDEYFSRKLKQPEEPYVKRRKRLYFENRLCIPKGKLRKTLNNMITMSLYWEDIEEERKP